MKMRWLPPAKHDNTCTRPYHCFQCVGPHGSRSVHSPHNHQAQAVYTSLASEGRSLHDINKKLKELEPLKYRRAPHRSKAMPSVPASTTQPPSLARAIDPALPYSSITMRNRFALLQEPEKEVHDTPQNTNTAPAPSSVTPTQKCRRSTRRNSNHQNTGCLAPPSTPSPPDDDSDLVHSTTLFLPNAKDTDRTPHVLFVASTLHHLKPPRLRTLHPHHKPHHSHLQVLFPCPTEVVLSNLFISAEGLPPLSKGHSLTWREEKEIEKKTFKDIMVQQEKEQKEYKENVEEIINVLKTKENIIRDAAEKKKKCL